MENYSNFLETADLPKDLKKLSQEQCTALCRQIRKIIMKTVMKNGGHLSSNLGTVELTVAMHRVFDSPRDKFVWDVGHQAYTHKLLTGRYDTFGTLRKEGGISGFLRPEESVHDPFISGHSSTSVSAALGIAEAIKLNGDNEHHAIAIIGDGSFTGGLAYEGLNNAGKSNANIIVILNHNDMSISKNVGALAKYLKSIRVNQKYFNAKKTVEKILDETPVVGEPLKTALQSSKSALKMFLYHSTMFEDLGFTYFGPVDGHNITELENTFRIAKKINKPVFIHVNTKKGRGYRPAEINPGAFHSIPGHGYSANNPKNTSLNTFSDNFGRKLAELAEKDKDICAVTAAMKYGTGLQHFAARFPERFYDVGIAESHAATFAAGLAKSGKIPVFAVYSSFLQRTYDQLIHDISLDKLHVVLAVDRAGIVGEDGETHQGMFDIPMLSGIPGVTVFSPTNLIEQSICLEKALYDTNGLAAVRYPKGGEEFGYCGFESDTDNYSYFCGGKDILAVSFGRIFNTLYEASRCGKTPAFDMLKLVRIIPIDEEVIELCMQHRKIIFFEESSKKSGIGERLLITLAERGYKGKMKIIAADGFIPQSNVLSAVKRCGLDRDSMISAIKDMRDNIET